MSKHPHQEIQAQEKPAFDLRTHIRDPKSGEITKKQPYKLVISRDEGEVFIRGGKRYHRNGELADKAAEK